MKHIVFLSLLMLRIFLLPASAQIEATTNVGKKVLLKNDGTWEYKSQPTEQNHAINMDCSDLVSTELDKVTGKSNTGAKEMIVMSEDGGKSGIGLYILKTEKSIIYSFKVVGSGCIDDKEKMNVLFRDGTRLEIFNDGDFNCEGKFTLYFGGIFGKKKELEIFRTKEIETIRIWTSRSHVQKNLTAEQSMQIMKTTDCLISK